MRAHYRQSARQWRQTDRCLSQSSAACATSRQPWSIVSEWPRSGNSMKSVMAGWAGDRRTVRLASHGPSLAGRHRPVSCGGLTAIGRAPRQVTIRARAGLRGHLLIATPSRAAGPATPLDGHQSQPAIPAHRSAKQRSGPRRHAPSRPLEVMKYANRRYVRHPRPLLAVRTAHRSGLFCRGVSRCACPGRLASASGRTRRLRLVVSLADEARPGASLCGPGSRPGRPIGPCCGGQCDPAREDQRPESGAKPTTGKLDVMKPLDRGHPRPKFAVAKL